MRVNALYSLSSSLKLSLSVKSLSTPPSALILAASILEDSRSSSFLVLYCSHSAFAVSAAFVFGDHLGFTAGFAPELLPAVIAGKLAGGVSGIFVALWLTRKK